MTHCLLIFFYICIAVLESPSQSLLNNGPKLRLSELSLPRTKLKISKLHKLRCYGEPQDLEQGKNVFSKKYLWRLRAIELIFLGDQKDLPLNSVHTTTTVSYCIPHLHVSYSYRIPKHKIKTCKSMCPNMFTGNKIAHLKYTHILTSLQTTII